MSEPSKRDLAVWSAYLGTALSLNPKVHDLGEKVLAQIEAAKSKLDSGKVDSSVAKAASAGVEACGLEEGTHPSIASKVRVVQLNLQAVADQAGSDSGTKVDRIPDQPKTDGKVDCPCGKRHAASSKVLARHQAKG